MTAESSDGLLGFARLRNHDHVWLRIDDRFQPFAHNGVILDAQDSNGGGLSYGSASAQTVNGMPETIA
jgi:hypothetical protein